MLIPPEPDETGLDYLRRLYHPGTEGASMAPIADLLGMWCVSVEPGEVVFGLTPGAQHANPIGTVHAGVTATMLDSVMGSAVHTQLPAGVGYTTLDLQVRYVRAVTEEAGTVFAHGNAVYVGRRTATASGRLVDGDGRLYAHATCGCIVLDGR